MCIARARMPRVLWTMRFVMAILRRFRSFLRKRDSLCGSPCGYMPLIRIHTLDWANRTINYIFWTVTIDDVFDWLIISRHSDSLLARFLLWHRSISARKFYLLPSQRFSPFRRVLNVIRQFINITVWLKLITL